MRVLTIGTFDHLHEGHWRLLERASDYALERWVTVGVNSDRFVAEYKGVETQPELVRMYEVSKEVSVAEVRLNDGPGIDLIRDVQPDLLVIGSDWLDRDYTKQLGTSADELAELGVSVLFLPRTPGISSTERRLA